MSAMTHLHAGVPVTDLDSSTDWYTRFCGRGPNLRAGGEIPWEIEEHLTLSIERDARVGTGRLTLSVVGLDAPLESLAARRLDHYAIANYSNGVHDVRIPDPDGNATAFAEPRNAA